MISRKLKSILLEWSEKMPVISITGPRQSGKTTLVKDAFPGYKYVTLENIEHREFAQEDPKGFLENYGDKVILDEAQNAPELFSYIQVKVDENKQNGQYILTGSNNFLLFEKISQSLAGRVAIFNLLPFSIDELTNTKYCFNTAEEYLFNGFYPRIYDQRLDPSKWLSDYVKTYIERDVRQIVNIGDLGTFQRFLKICAGRVGQIINFSAISNEIGVTDKTIKKWLSILEASYIVFLLQPYYKNYNKRIIKSPKLYFFDVGLASNLLGIRNKEEINFHFAKGSLFENLVIIELMKGAFNKNMNPNFYYWRESNMNEIDLIIDKGLYIDAIEIKSGKTLKTDFLKNLDKWKKISSNETKNTYLVYAGNSHQIRNGHKIINWSQLSEIS